MKINRIATLAGALLLALEAGAAPVSADRALEIARIVLSDEPVITRAADERVQILWNGEDDTQTTPALYIATRAGGGFVIIAGDDNARPLLAYSETGQFRVDGMPDNVRWWIETMKAHVRAQHEQTAEIGQLWAEWTPTRSELNTNLVTDRVERLTPTWDQGNSDLMTFGEWVFNAACPLVGLTRAPAGCIPVALGEILTWQSGVYGEDMPVKAHGAIGGYNVSYGYYRLNAYEPDTVYDWEGLRKLTDLNAIYRASSPIRQNLAHLLADIGATVQVQYSPRYGTGGSTWNIIGPMANHFDYSRTAHMETAANYTPHRWTDMLMREIDKHPLYYDGKRESGAGHAFVFDGYGVLDGETVFHVNFGWGGLCNGYYYHDALSATWVNDYSYDCHALFDFFPDARHRTNSILRLGMTVGEGFTIPESLPTGEPFELKFSSLLNTGTAVYSGILQARLVRRDGRETAIGEETLANLQTYYGASPYYLTVTLPKDFVPEFGDKIVLYCSTDADMQVFEPITLREDGTMIGELPLLPVPFIKRETAYRVGDYFLFRLMNHTCLYAGTVWTVTAPNGTVTDWKQADDRIRLTVAGRYRIEAAVAPSMGAAVTDRIMTYVDVK